MHRSLPFLAFTCTLFALYGPVGAQPSKISWQGYLEDGGSPIDGLVSLSFALYGQAVGGEAVWTKDTTGVNVQAGIASLALGPFEGVDFSTQFWLGVGINGGDELSPRSALTSVPMAFTLHAPAKMEAAVTATGNETVGVLSAVNTATSGRNYGVRGETRSPDGRGVVGIEKTDSGLGQGIAVMGLSRSTDGTGVYGTATSETGRNTGVKGKSHSPGGVGVLGENTALTQAAIGVSGISESASGIGVQGYASSTTGAAKGLSAVSNAESGQGVLALATHPSGANKGISAETNSPNGWSGYFSGGRGLYVDTTLHIGAGGVKFPDGTMQSTAVEVAPRRALAWGLVYGGGLVKSSENVSVVGVEGDRDFFIISMRIEDHDYCPLWYPTQWTKLLMHDLELTKAWTDGINGEIVFIWNSGAGNTGAFSFVVYEPFAPFLETCPSS
jgi:hypothetical protein